MAADVLEMARRVREAPICGTDAVGLAEFALIVDATSLALIAELQARGITGNAAAQIVVELRARLGLPNPTTREDADR